MNSNNSAKNRIISARNSGGGFIKANISSHDWSPQPVSDVYEALKTAEHINRMSGRCQTLKYWCPNLKDYLFAAWLA